MSSSYSFFRNLIDNYQLESYSDTTIINNINIFIDNFCLKEDAQLEFNNTYFNNNNFNSKKFPNKRRSSNYFSKNKYDKIEKSNDTIYEKVNITYSTDNKILYLIRGNLNKITQDNYTVIINDLVKDIINYKKNTEEISVDIFNILSEEIINKSIGDQKYQFLYIDIMISLTNNKNLINEILPITCTSGNFYYKLFDNEIGPFKNNKECYDDAINNTILMKYILRNLNKIFLDNDIYILEVVDDKNNELSNKKKKYLFNYYELLSKMYIKNIVNNKILNIMLIKLLHCDNNFEMINDTEIELSYIIFNIVNTYYGKSKIQDLIYSHFNDRFYNDIINIFNQLIDNKEINKNKRNLFFMNNIIKIINGIRDHTIKENIKLNNSTVNSTGNNTSNSTGNNTGNSTVNNTGNSTNSTDNSNIEEIKLLIISSLKSQDFNKFIEDIKQINKLEQKHKYEIINNIINSILDYKNFTDYHLKVYNLIANKYDKLLLEILDSIYNNLDDLLLDSPYITNNLLFTFRESNFDFLNNIKDKFVSYILTLSSIDDNDLIDDEMPFR